MKARASVVPAAVILLVGCAYANGYDPSRYGGPAPTASLDPEIEPLPPSPKRRLRDPRGVGLVDAGPRPATREMLALADATAAVVGSPDTGVTSGDEGAVSPAARAEATCGSKADPCPMQRFMRGALATAHTPGTLTAAFTRVAGMSPDPAWAWTAIATRGADLANAGDLAAAKAQCTACHDAYVEPYRTRFRARGL